MAIETKQVLLDAAEALFAEQGLAATSLRAITARAGVNLAAVNYHFGTKEALAEAVLARRVVPMNRERLARLASLERSPEASLDALVEAYVGPALEMSHQPGGGRFVRLLGRSYTEPDQVIHQQVRALYGEVTERFRAAFARALPGLPPTELYWRLHFLVGTLAYCMAGTDVMRLISSSRLEEEGSTQRLVSRLVVFLRHGLAAPPPETGALRPAQAPGGR